MNLSQNGPSPFAVLLRRSKFASYDPQIGQVYTTYGGHAHRGNWGFKRPLPNRRSNGFIFMRKIDTSEQQTDWDTAESSARWIKRWDEMGKVLKVQEMGRWKPVPMSINSEFDSNASRKDLAVEWSEKDYRSASSNLTPKQFEKYVERLRKLRPAFKEFLLKEELALRNDPHRKNTKHLASQRSNIVLTGGGEVDMFASVQNGSNTHIDQFLSREAARNTMDNSNSTVIYSKPQKFAGLEYTYMSQSQANYLRKPFPGRVVSAIQEGKESRKQVIAAGGLLGVLPMNAGVVAPTDFGTETKARIDRNHGKGMFRLGHIQLAEAPSVVNKRPQGISGAKFVDIQLVSAEKKETGPKENPHPLGSADYVAMHSMIQSSYNRDAIGRVMKGIRSAQPSNDAGHRILDSLSKAIHNPSQKAA